MGKNNALRLFALGILIILVAPTLVQKGMFMDGLQYAIVGKNLSEGLGTFWYPHLSATWYKAGSTYFMEHPPLAYFLQSLYFDLLGDSMYTERIYSFSICLLTAYLIHLIWRQIFKAAHQLRPLSWLPILLWIMTPIVFWTYPNNVQETTLGLFDLLSILMVVKAHDADRINYKYVILAGIALVAALLTKGVQGLFPLTAFILLGLTLGGKYWISQAVIRTTIITASAITVFAIVSLSAEARDSLSFYINERLLNRISSEPVVSNRLYSVRKLILEILPMAGLSILTYAIARYFKSKLATDYTYGKWATFFLLVGFSASLPLTLTSIQRPFYLAPSIPYFALSLAVCIAPFTLTLTSRINTKILTGLAAVTLILSIVLTTNNLGKVGRDKDELYDVSILGEHIEKNITIGVSKAVYNNWSFQFYLLREYNISMKIGDTTAPYFLSDLNPKSGIEAKFKRKNIKLKQHVLFQK